MAERKHYFFDMDGTLCADKEPCMGEIELALFRLAKGNDVIVVSGAEYKQMKKQLPFLPGRFFVMSQSGNFTSKGWRTLWKNRLKGAHKAIASEHIRILRSISDPVANPNDLVQDRGGQISYSVLGHNAPVEEKRVWDPTGAKRQKLLDTWPLSSTAVQVRIGGTTCLDYSPTGWGKAGNVEKLIKANGWNVNDCWYIGDQLYEGGNDHEVINVLGPRTYSVRTPQDTLEFINSVL